RPPLPAEPRKGPKRPGSSADGERTLTGRTGFPRVSLALALASLAVLLGLVDGGGTGQAEHSPAGQKEGSRPWPSSGLRLSCRPSPRLSAEPPTYWSPLSTPAPCRSS